MQYIAGLAVGLVFFICTIKAYTLGIGHGRQLANGNVPKVKLNPVRAVTEAIEQHTAKVEEKKADADLNDILNCSQESMLRAIKIERSK